MTTKSDILMRWLIRRDMPIVLEIEKRSFRHAWSEEHFISQLRERNIIGMVATSNEQTCGYMIYALENKHIELLNFAVHPDYRRMGVGREMLDKLKSKLNFRRRIAISLYVSEANLAGQLFFRANQFEATRVRRNLYDECDEDAYRMIYSQRIEA